MSPSPSISDVRGEGGLVDVAWSSYGVEVLALMRENIYDRISYLMHHVHPYMYGHASYNHMNSSNYL